MQMSRIFHPPLRSLPPMYAWPLPLKRVVLTLATLACFGAYLLLIVALISLFVAVAVGR